MIGKNLTIDEIKEELRFAALIMRKLPPVRVQGYVSTWPDIIYDANEKFFMDRKPTFEPPYPGEVSRMDEILEWLKVLNLDEKKLVWKRANKVPWKVLEQEFNLHRSNMHERHKIALNKIMISLR